MRVHLAAFFAASVLLEGTLAVSTNALSKDASLAYEAVPIEAAQTQTLAQTGAIKKNAFASKDYFGIGKFIVGIFLIPFSLVMLWKNERKLVVYTRIMD